MHKPKEYLREHLANDKSKCVHFIFNYFNNLFFCLPENEEDIVEHFKLQELRKEEQMKKLENERKLRRAEADMHLAEIEKEKKRKQTCFIKHFT